MFARTERLLLRPGWAEDARALAQAIADEAIVRNLATAPWPFALRDAEAVLAAPRDPVLPSFLIYQRGQRSYGLADAVLVGAGGLGRRPSGAVEIGYWIARDHWNRGFATEAGHALLAIATALALPRLEASYFIDNPASGRVLEKLGFLPTGITAPRYSCARGGKAMARLCWKSLGVDEVKIAA